MAGLSLFAFSLKAFLFEVFKFAFFASYGSPDGGVGFYIPQQVHLAFGEKPNDFVVVWSTYDDPGESVVRYGVTDEGQTANGTRKQFVEGPGNRTQWYHHAVLRGLEFNTTYVYKVGSRRGWSSKLTFKTPPAGEDWVVRAAVYGDLGLTQAYSLPYITSDVEAGLYDFVIHVGDFAYDLHNNSGLYGDLFMAMIEPVASRVPYMTCAGNHEATDDFNFANYKNIFSMPQSSQFDSQHYSWNIGPVHFVAFSTEYYFEIDKNSSLFELCKRQFHWLRKDLEEAAREENRRVRPWIVMYGHRPMYCSSQEDECPWLDVPQRSGAGLPEPGYGLEPLLKEFGVDLVFFGHQHAYERLWPIYNYTVYNGSYEQPYVNPGAPVHIVTGAAGCSEGVYAIDHKKPYTAVASTDFGYTKFEAHNKTHILIQQVSVEKEGEVIDSVWIVKEEHKAYHL